MKPTKQPEVPSMTCSLVKIKPDELITVPEPWLAIVLLTGQISLTVDFIIESWLAIPKSSVGDCGLGWFGASQYCDVAGAAVSADGQS